MKVLFCASEAWPFAKSGGLADVAHALPKALSKHADVTLMVPWYRFMDLPLASLERMTETTLSFGGVSYDVTFYRHVQREKNAEVLFVYSEILSERETLYGPSGSGYADNDLRFALFSRAIVWYAQYAAFDILHLNDWHTALAALFAKERQIGAKVVFTIHNLAFQGIFDHARLELLGIDPRRFQMEALEFYGRINFMKAGIAFCDALTTVSPTYAQEILTPEFGCGLEGFLRKHSDKLRGILNGIDTHFFDPVHDRLLACGYQGDLAAFKACNRRALLSVQDEVPLFAFTGRLTEQKGIDLLIALGERLARLPLRFVFLGEGEKRFSEALERLSKGHERIHFFEGYSEKRAHLLYAAADFLVMPSRFEPCGLNQMIAMHYGTVPIVHAVGGLRDTVHANCSRCGCGLPFEECSTETLLQRIEAALALFEDKEAMARINRFNMACDFSFAKPAQAYLALYGELLGKDEAGTQR